MNQNQKNHSDDVLNQAIQSLREEPADEDRMKAAISAARRALVAATDKNHATQRTTTSSPEWKSVIKSRWAKAAAAVAAVVLTALVIINLLKPFQRAYALEQTAEALKQVRFFHMVRFDKEGNVVDERWIEIGPDGRQIRYRQDNTPSDFHVVQNADTTAAYHGDKDTLVLWDPNDKQYVWYSNMWDFFNSVPKLVEAEASGSVLIEEDVEFLGQRAHRLTNRKTGEVYYIDPATKLPIGMGDNHVFSYETPPPGTFDIEAAIAALPKDVVVVDKRPGAPPAEEPEWMKEEKAAQELFDPARYALADGDYETAADFFEQVVEAQPGRNWAWYWLGDSYYELGEYEAAREAYAKVIDMFSEFEGQPYYCYYSLYSRGLAYAQLGMLDEAREDFDRVIGVMIRYLRDPMGPNNRPNVFDYADDPRNRGRRGITAEQSVWEMIKRLRHITGMHFGYDPEATPEQNEKAIAAWEQWWQLHSKDYEILIPRETPGGALIAKQETLPTRAERPLPEPQEQRRPEAQPSASAAASTSSPLPPASPDPARARSIYPWVVACVAALILVAAVAIWKSTSRKKRG